MNNFFMNFPDNKTKAVTLSYDDGCRYDIRFSKTISKYNLKCTFNINSAFIGTDDWHLTKEEIFENIVSAGHEIAVHTAHHRAPGVTDLTEGIAEVLECRQTMERMFGRIVKGMAYPNGGILYFENGACYNDVKSYLTQLGIVYARSLGGDNDDFLLPCDWHNWVPTAHHNNPHLMQYIEKFLSMASKSPRIFYLWGHSYEFDRDNNWEYLDEICQKLSGKNDIWYATNIEIYNYITAYRSLVFNVDKTLVFNPTAYTVWFSTDNKNYCIKPGETINI